MIKYTVLISKKSYRGVKIQKIFDPTGRFSERAGKMKLTQIICLGIGIVFLCACSPPEATLILEDDTWIVVKVNGKIMTSNQMYNEMINLFQTLGQDFSTDEVEERRAEFQAQAIQNLINTELLVEEAIRRGFTVELAEIDTRLNELQEAYKSQDELRSELKTRDLTEAELAEEARRGLYVEKIIAQEIENVTSPEYEEIHRYYNENQELLMIPEQIHVAHIVVEVLYDDPVQVRDAKLAEIERLRQLILDGADFGETAAQYSDCPSKLNNGDLGWITRGRMRPEFTEAAFALPPGTISEVVETAEGFHLIKIFEHHPKTLPELETIEDYVIQRVIDEKIQARILHLIEDLRSQATINIDSAWQ